MVTGLPQRLRLVGALRFRLFAVLWSGQSVSVLGHGVFGTALAWQVLTLTHSAAALGLVSIAWTGSINALVIVGGVAADREPRRLVLPASDTRRADGALAVEPDNLVRSRACSMIMSIV